MKRLLTFALCLVLLVSMLVMPTMAAGMDNFQKTMRYNDSIFSDVSGRWFRNDIANAYEYGLVNGRGDLFAPEENVSLAEAITMASRVNAIYNEKDIPDANGKWYMRYVNYAVSAGIIKTGQFSDYERAATRSEVAIMFYRALPASEFAEINTVYAIPDVPAYRADSTVLTVLYRAGILTGKDADRNCFPDEAIYRCEAVTIMNRVVDPSQRASFSLVSTPEELPEPEQPKPVDRVAQFVKFSNVGVVTDILTLYPTSGTFTFECVTSNSLLGSVVGAYETGVDANGRNYIRCAVRENTLQLDAGGLVTAMLFTMNDLGVVLKEVYPTSYENPLGGPDIPINKVGNVVVLTDVMSAAK